MLHSSKTNLTNKIIVKSINVVCSFTLVSIKRDINKVVAYSQMLQSIRFKSISCSIAEIIYVVVFLELHRIFACLRHIIIMF